MISALGNSLTLPMRMVGSLFLSKVQKAIRNEEMAVIFLKEYWPQIMAAVRRRRGKKRER